MRKPDNWHQLSAEQQQQWLKDIEAHQAHGQAVAVADNSTDAEVQRLNALVAEKEKRIRELEDLLKPSSVSSAEPAQRWTFGQGGSSSGTEEEQTKQKSEQTTSPPPPSTADTRKRKP